MKNNDSALIQELRNNLVLITQNFLIKYDHTIPTDSETINIMLSAYFNSMFIILDVYAEQNQTITKNAEEFKEKITNALRSVSFMKLYVEVK